jgi:hypothetical protein
MNPWGFGMMASYCTSAAKRQSGLSAVPASADDDFIDDHFIYVWRAVEQRFAG